MRFLVDCSAGRRLNNLLVSAGHDITNVADINPRMLDGEILELAVKENRIILTLDKDFEEMVWRFGRKHCGILRLSNLRSDILIPLLEKVLTSCTDDLMKGAIVIADVRKIRVRKKL